MIVSNLIDQMCWLRRWEQKSWFYTRFFVVMIGGLEKTLDLCQKLAVKMKVVEKVEENRVINENAAMFGYYSRIV